eukprot:831209-Amphidinium_carterae.1
MKLTSCYCQVKMIHCQSVDKGEAKWIDFLNPGMVRLMQKHSQTFVLGVGLALVVDLNEDA